MSGNYQQSDHKQPPKNTAKKNTNLGPKSPREDQATLPKSALCFFKYMTNSLFAQVSKAEPRRLRIARAKHRWWSEEVAGLVQANGGAQQARALKHHYRTITVQSSVPLVRRRSIAAVFSLPPPAAAGRPVSSVSFSFCFVLLCSRHRVGAALLAHRPRPGFFFRSLLLSSAHTKDPDVATLEWWHQKVYQCLRVNNCTDRVSEEV